MKRMNRFAVLGLLFVLPSCILVGSGLLGLNVPGMLVNPVFVLGGLLAALGLNLFSILRVGTDHGPDGAVAAVTVRIGVMPANIAIALLSTFLLACIAAYLFVENFQPRLMD